MYARAEPPRHQRRLALDRGNLATPPGVDHRDGKTTTQCVNQFQDFFLSELVLHYKQVNHTLDALSEEQSLQQLHNPDALRSVARKNYGNALALDYSGLCELLHSSFLPLFA
jgi:hypothetical protein